MKHTTNTDFLKKAVSTGKKAVRKTGNAQILSALRSSQYPFEYLAIDTTRFLSINL